MATKLKRKAARAQKVGGKKSTKAKAKVGRATAGKGPDVRNVRKVSRRSKRRRAKFAPVVKKLVQAAPAVGVARALTAESSFPIGALAGVVWQQVATLIARRPGLLTHAVGEQLKGALLERMFGVSAQSTFFRAAAETEMSPALLGVGYGYKEAAGLTDPVPAVRVYVERKLPLAEIPLRDRVPAEIEGVPTDVIETGRIEAQSPLAGGDSIGHANLNGNGTLGCIVERDGERFLLSNTHVLAHLEAGVILGRAGDAVIHPARRKGGTAANRVAELVDFEPIRFGAFDVNWIDAAIARLDPGVSVETALRGLGSFTGPEVPPAEAAGQSLPVSKSGQVAPGVTHGQVRGYQEDVRVWYGNSRAFFKLQMAVRGDQGGLFSQPGDSGSLVVTRAEPRRPVGLLFAGGASGPSFVTPMDRLLSRFRIRIVPA